MNEQSSPSMLASPRGRLATRVRFAPSPTGFLHVGGARSALFNWLFARRNHGVFILRIEDTDEARSTHESVDAVLDSMAWLGIHWDEGPVPGSSTGRDLWEEKGKYGPYFQMRRLEQFKRYIDQMLQARQAYPCYCAPEELEQMRRLAQLEKRPPRYDGRCRALTDADRKKRESEGRKASVRFKMPESGATVVKDLIRGEVSFDNALLQDFVIQKTSGGPTYNFACVIDDHLMEISHVIRGDEHLSNTPSQLRLYEALGWEPPEFAHLSMILGPDGAKLSKRHGATSVLEYRNQGYLPEAMRNTLALLGWSTPDSQQLFTAEELVAKFDLAGCQRNPAIFDPQKLLWMNGTTIRRMTVKDLIEASGRFLRTAGLDLAPRERLEAAVSLEHEKIKLLPDVPRLVAFFFKDVEFDPKAVDKVLKAPGADKVLEGLSPALKDLSPFTQKPLEERVRRFAAESGLKPGQVFHPLRVAVSGRTEGPTLFGMLELLGRDTVLERLQKARTALGPTPSTS